MEGVLPVAGHGAQRPPRGRVLQVRRSQPGAGARGVVAGVHGCHGRGDPEETRTRQGVAHAAARRGRRDDQRGRRAGGILVRCHAGDLVQHRQRHQVVHAGAAAGEGCARLHQPAAVHGRVLLPHPPAVLVRHRGTGDHRGEAVVRQQGRHHRRRARRQLHGGVHGEPVPVPGDGERRSAVHAGARQPEERVHLHGERLRVQERGDVPEHRRVRYHHGGSVVVQQREEQGEGGGEQRRRRAG
mmetsp:Transcript_1112/g.4580  ORF Transcript_1112/g.4580 Transcript_1112/m.4580 type:complete len:242 (-) Transcript_1112:1963-2688(-)